jgi:arylsulfatase A-like enzyme
MSNNHPNILIITTDQQRTDSLSCYGSTFTQTPNLDRLGTEGAVCERAYCTNPVCTPARASIFTGQYMSRHGAWNVGLNVPEDVVMISHRLDRLGFRTHYIGKAHFQAFGGTPEETLEPVRGWERHYPAFRGPYYGFETVELALGHVTYGLAGHYGAWVRSRVSEEQFQLLTQARRRGSLDFGGNAHDWDIPLWLHNSVWTADHTIEFLRTHDARRPFLLAVGFQDPHHPHGVPVAFEERVDPKAVPLPRYAEGELEDKPSHFRIAHRGQLEGSEFRGDYWVAGQGRGADFAQVSEQDARWGRAYYYTMVKLIDQQMGRILDGLDEQGLAENTLVIFTTDHGELLGDHGLWMKGPFHYEELVRIPMLLRWPEGIPGRQRVRGLISQVDLVPTILAAAGQEVPAEIDGVDTLPLLRGEVEAVRDATIIECTDDPRNLRLKTVVTADRKLTVYHGQSFGELYDLQADPGEVKNLWDTPVYATDRQRLTGHILDHMEPLERRVPRICYA